jgi:large subunit ribosomal protein L31e
MADEKKLERVYTINLSKAYSYLRTKRAMRAVKILRAYLARHFKVELEGVKLSEALNSYIWRDSIQRPPRRVKVKGVREGGTLHAYLHGEEEANSAKAQKKAAKKDAAAKKKEARPKPEAKKAGTEKAAKNEPKKAAAQSEQKKSEAKR